MNKNISFDVRKKSLTALRKIADDAAENIAKSIARDAESNFRSATYDGPQTHLDHIRVEAGKKSNGTWQVTASGYAVSFVEYGTGIAGDGTYKGNVPSGYNYNEQYSGIPSHIPGNKGWYFTADQELANAPAKAYRYIRGVDEYGELIDMPERRYKGQSRRGTIGYVLESDVPFFKAKGGKILAKESDKTFFARRKADALKSGALVKEETKNTYYTTGTKANNCLYNAIEEAMNNLPKVARGRKK